MRARYWLLVLYIVLGVGLSLTTGDWTWMGWALPISLGATTVIFLSGYSREFTVRRRWRQMSKLADHIGARDGRLVHERFQRWGVLGYQPYLYLITIHGDTEENARRRLVANAAEVGYVPNSRRHLVSRGERLMIRISTCTRDVQSRNTWAVGEGEVQVDVCIEERGEYF